MLLCRRQIFLPNEILFVWRVDILEERIENGVLLHHPLDPILAMLFRHHSLQIIPLMFHIIGYRNSNSTLRARPPMLWLLYLRLERLADHSVVSVAIENLLHRVIIRRGTLGLFGGVSESPLRLTSLRLDLWDLIVHEFIPLHSLCFCMLDFGSCFCLIDSPHEVVAVRYRFWIIDVLVIHFHWRPCWGLCGVPLRHVS